MIGTFAITPSELMDYISLKKAELRDLNKMEPEMRPTFIIKAKTEELMKLESMLKAAKEAELESKITPSPT